MPEVTKLYADMGWPIMEKNGFGKYLVGYFISDTGTLHQLLHIWKFESDQERRDYWKRLYGNDSFMEFAKQVRPHILSQDVQLLTGAPWGPNP